MFFGFEFVFLGLGVGCSWLVIDCVYLWISVYQVGFGCHIFDFDLGNHCKLFVAFGILGFLH